MNIVNRNGQIKINNNGMAIKKSFLLIYLTIASIYATSFAQGIVLDSTFAINGKATTDIDDSDNRAYCVAIQDDNKIVTAGWSHNGHDYDFAIIRYNYDGSLDSNFGNSGKVTTDVQGNDDRLYSVSLTNEQKILAAGYSKDSFGITDFCINRYNSNGSLDSSFGNFGKLVTRINNNNSRSYGLTLQNDGKIIMVGQSYTGPNGDFAIVRYNADGSLDSAFNIVGISTVDFGGWNDKAMSVFVTPNGKIIVSGLSSNHIALARLKSDGSIDSTFATNGKVIVNTGGIANVKTSMKLLEEGKILIAGTYYSPATSKDIMLVRFSENGFLDSSFNSNGTAIVDYGNSYDEGSSVAIQSDDKIIVTGETYVNGSHSDFAILRFNTDGSLDSTASPNGKLTTDFNGFNDWGYASIIQNDGKLIVVGESNSGSSSDFAIARYASKERVNNVQDDSTNHIRINVFPNPFSSQLTFSLSDNEQAAVSLYDFLGHQILRQTFANAAIINTEQLADGIYFYVLRCGKRAQKTGKVIKQ